MAKAIMVQGTMSNAGKSLVAAGLCRIFHQDGYRVAPFKSQNMALNSYITAEGLEMGRAQVMQAQAAGIAPTAAMNPILLKPTGEMGSQVIVGGRVLGNMTAAEYYRRKQEMIPPIMAAYDQLSRDYDIIVLEGAGSPAEINLKDNDIVNMGMARMAGAPVLLVGDIDRGGVFASLVGTMALLEPWEQEMVKAVVINKFRGDKDILAPGLAMLEERIHRPVAGVLPYLRLDLDDEDSLSDRLDAREKALIDVAVLRLPRISNFTDFNGLSRLPGVGVRYVASPAGLGCPDLIILPGTKNTMEDLLWLRQNGLEAAIKKFAALGGPVFGICGGYQMLGAVLRDPESIEHGGEIFGMGLLPVETVFTREKTRTQVSGRFMQMEGPLSALGGRPVEGYEIHMGQTRLKNGAKALCMLHQCNGRAVYQPDGCQRGTVYGTYLHGVFDNAEAAQGLLEALCLSKGLQVDETPVMEMERYREEQYDRLADAMREHLDMKLIYRILEEGVSL
ncbi:cobyric acid synthase [Zongyangia hominis]|uniref:Cobyric acid synthase n=1 Tax=Zongyangia hominis TaxID=2763677 RepID=A0A926EAA7_9FIRM|nr:cobyric acid synthase [Zongyangia hominis]MBC8569305.1 cobyric acid synthase [Zongyangia hominis]